MATTFSPISEWIEKLDDVAQEGSNYRAVCPKHGGHGLLFREDRSNGRVIFDCKAGCEYSEVAEELYKLGLRLWSDRFEFPYRDADGNELVIKVKWRKNGKKMPPYYKCRGKNGVPANHNSKSKGTAGPGGLCLRCGRGAIHVLYRLPELLAGIEQGSEVWFCEGEKDAEAVLENKGSRNLVVTTTPNGIGDWNTEYRDILARAPSIVIVAHNDTELATGKNPGMTGAWKRSTALSEFTSVRVVRAAEGNDAFDHFSNGHGFDDFVTLERDELAQFANPGTPTGSLSDGSEFTFTQSEYADRFVALYGDRFRYITAEDCWLYYDDGRWREDQYDAAFHFAEKLCRQILAETPEKSEDGKHRNGNWVTAKERCGAGNIGAIVRISRTRRPIVTVRSKFDTDPYLINMPCGTMDLRTGSTRPHDQRDMITKITPVDPAEVGPEFDSYFEYVQPDSHWRDQILRSLGYSLSGNYGEYLFVHSGSGGNGKTTLLELAAAALGSDYSVEGSWKLLNSRGEDSHETVLAELEGKRFSYVQLGNRSLSPEQLRSIVAEPSFKGRQMRQDSRTIRATHTFHVAQNDPPALRKLDASVRRRIVHIPWTVVIPADRKVEHLFQRLEAGYLLKLMIEGYRAFKPSEIDLSATQEYFANNTLFAFLSDTFEPDEEGFITADKTLELYAEWCTQRFGSARRVTKDLMGSAMTDFGFGKGQRRFGSTVTRGRTKFRIRNVPSVQ